MKQISSELMARDVGTYSETLVSSIERGGGSACLVSGADGIVLTI